jgi:hypothetical protein
MCKTKKCIACLEEKELCEFYKDSNKSDGLFTKCKICIINKIKIPKEPILDHKICKFCEEGKILEEFNIDKRGKFGRSSKCKKCLNNPPKLITNILKTCTLCNETKDCLYFSVDNYSKDKYSSACLGCRKNDVRKQKEGRTDLHKMCTKCNIRKPFDEYSFKEKEKINLNSVCKTCTLEYTRKRYYTETSKQYREKTKEASREYLKEYNIINNEKLIAQKKEYYINNKKAINGFKKEWVKKRRQDNPLFKLSSNIRHSILEAIKRNNTVKVKSTNIILGCTMEEFKIHIESQFLNWMSWDNYGNVCGTGLQYNCSWDLDHIIPVSYAKTEEEVYLLNHWSNFQPLCSRFNRWEKSANVPLLCNTELKLIIE